MSIYAFLLKRFFTYAITLKILKTTKKVGYMSVII